MKSPFSQIIIVGILCTATFAAYGMGYALISAKSAAVADVQSKIDAKTETMNRIAATRATLASITNDEASVQSYFVPEADVVTFIDSLQAHGRVLKAVVDVTSVAKSGTSVQPALALALTIQGTFDAMMRTVGSIEYAPYALSISSLDVTQDAKDSWHADLKLLVGSRTASSTPNTP
jgi:hypothetical protein